MQDKNLNEVQVRSAQIRSINEETRTIAGIAVPYGSTVTVGGFYQERVERGAFGDTADIDLRLFYEHKEPIGRVTRAEESDEGLLIEARISDTPRGNEVYTLMRDGVLSRFSVSFNPIENRIEEDSTVVRTKARLNEVSVVAFPAYDGAKVSEVRAEEKSNNKEAYKKDMSNEIKYAPESDVADLRGSVADLERRFAMGNTVATSRPLFRSAGEFVKALAGGDAEAAKAEVRAYTGAVLADSHTSNDWKNDVLKIVDRGRPLVALFDRGPLGSNGNYVEYPKVSGVTGDAAVQAAEGDTLAYLEVAVTTATAAVKTYGVYSELSRQVIERSDVSYLDATLKAQAISYAKVTNAAVRSAMVAATPQTGASFTLASATAANFTGAIVDAARKIEANGVISRTADFVLVSADVFDKMAGLFDSNGRPLFDFNGDGSNTIGNANVRTPSLTVAGMTVVLDTGLANKTFYVANSDAVTTWENSGAPLRLQDENILNLTKQFSIYGYLAIGVKDANGLVKAAIA